MPPPKTFSEIPGWVGPTWMTDREQIFIMEVWTADREYEERLELARRVLEAKLVAKQLQVRLRQFFGQLGD